MSILIVEDDEFNQEVLQGFLKILCPNEDIYIVDNSKDALDIFKKKDIKLVFMDIALPGENGIEIMKEMKKEKSNIPIVAFTAFAVSGDKERLLLEGFDDYLSKPIKLENLQKLISKYI